MAFFEYFAETIGKIIKIETQPRRKKLRIIFGDINISRLAAAGTTLSAME